MSHNTALEATLVNSRGSAQLSQRSPRRSRIRDGWNDRMIQLHLCDLSTLRGFLMLFCRNPMGPVPTYDATFMAAVRAPHRQH
jgi:hypothetical protein